MDDETVGYLMVLGAIVAIVAGIIHGSVWLVTWLVTHVIAPHWRAIVICIAVVAIAPWLVRFLIYLLAPSVRRARIRRYWRKLGAAERRRGEEFEREINQLFRDAKRRADDIADGHIW